MTLFSRPDFEKAVQLAASARPARPSRAAAAKAASSIKAAQQTAQLRVIASQLAGLSNTLADLAAQQKGLSQAIGRLESNLADQRQADLSEINRQLGSWAQKQSDMAAPLPTSHLISLVAQLVNLNQLPRALQKLSANVKKLAEPKEMKAKKAKKVTSSTKTKSKKR